MASEAYILAFDTSAAHCAAALLCGERLVAARVEPMSRGQAERLIPLCEDILAEAGAAWSDLSALGVGVGPGNFTGIRIGVSAARGLALSLDIPAVGVSIFDAISEGQAEPHLPAVAAPRDQVYIAEPGAEAALVGRADAEAMGLPLAFAPDGQALAEAIARIAARRAGDAPAPPAPLYLKPADAAPARDAPPVIIDDLA
ncbi:tRNA (adenosine(37)-N6)-threonylcarbamoyltransferase complex dimerization subunit type 1 TsaB [Roseovarius sp. LXJ103]|uniref:tRNA (adenosine(37)-N6)-threonylcarbamoyltransferase complex dimerization subunit type 1 TsaB n=1 Tax=Roseovarius carneus TaxID=2853164 RepID=UPI000D60B9B5|nr:tRNA (adenosine(37)-N6)-threonylcarbamoyltransferase complex dimerization subunit type 1 TsaB [Roseovarius carneus]MBZ8118238.1 tRNA (adenosine(37)-N6)-threonylcarbamoyltransferase complex dimerization subunit type 1 TsaB [Roseovarius carneus]PWE36039.1 tRNA (adenosine(37)-N6)-threonylcarbamoyltransferase complex dimerization subunit type 1 TsaB [Pelagicola sp. LXJ1103]